MDMREWVLGFGVEKLGETIQGVLKEREVVLVELAPVAKACEVGREMD